MHKVVVMFSSALVVPCHTRWVGETAADTDQTRASLTVQISLPSIYGSSRCSV